jgi:hypothetical protein
MELISSADRDIVRPGNYQGDWFMQRARRADREFSKTDLVLRMYVGGAFNAPVNVLVVL